MGHFVQNYYMNPTFTSKLINHPVSTFPLTKPNAKRKNLLHYRPNFDKLKNSA